MITWIFIIQLAILCFILRIYFELLEIKNNIEVKQNWDRLNESTERLHKIIDEVEDEK